MNKFMLHRVHIYGIVICLVVLCHAGGSMKQPKRLANNQHGLFPFPRVGRSGENTWSELVKPNHGRISLFAFPRVGRSDLNPYMVAKRNDQQNMNSGVWFGPRLGKVQKRDVYLYDIPQDYSARDLLYPDESQGARHVHYTPRLGRESDEEFDENDEQSPEP